MVKQTGIFNVSVLAESAQMDIYKRFGYASGRDTSKFDGFNDVSRSKNGILYLNRYSNAYLSGKVIEEKDLGTHTLFTADVTDARVLTEETSVTYDYVAIYMKAAHCQRALYALYANMVQKPLNHYNYYIVLPGRQMVLDRLLYLQDSLF